MSIRVLLAEPEQLLLDTYLDYLVRIGFEVATASTGADCLDKLRNWKPDVLVLEPEMSNGSSQAVLDEITEHPDLGCVPILILSRRDRQAVSYPVFEYHVKPFSMAGLVKSIRRAVDHSLSHQS